jgi:23S rRNA (uracil1939-C5)-methyltransferase
VFCKEISRKINLEDEKGKMKTNDIYNVIIEDVTNMGYGVARVEGQAVFVPGAVDGDEGQIRIAKAGQNLNYGEILKLTRPSPYRVKNDCPVFPRCGGCSFRHISYEHEKELKRRFVESAMRKSGVNIEVSPVFSINEISGWRNKVVYPHSDGKIGCYSEKSHDIVEAESCLIQDRAFDEIVDYIKSKLNDGNSFPNLRHLYLRRGVNTGEIMLCFAASEVNRKYNDAAVEIINKFPSVKSVMCNINPADTNVILGSKTLLLSGKPVIRDTLCGIKFDISAESFYQVNTKLTEQLYRRAAELLDLKTGEKLLDLYCGIGTIGLSCTHFYPGIDLVGIEIVDRAVENAKCNAALNGISAKFICADASDKKVIEAELKSADSAIVDPPRKGLGADLCKTLSHIGPKRLVYISCNPQTLARDLKSLEEAYRFTKAEPFDMFPRTGHVETMVLMSRKGILK